MASSHDKILSLGTIGHVTTLKGHRWSSNSALVFRDGRFTSMNCSKIPRYGSCRRAVCAWFKPRLSQRFSRTCSLDMTRRKQQTTKKNKKTNTTNTKTNKTQKKTNGALT